MVCHSPTSLTRKQHTNEPLASHRAEVTASTRAQCCTTRRACRETRSNGARYEMTLEPTAHCDVLPEPSLGSQRCVCLKWLRRSFRDPTLDLLSSPRPPNSSSQNWENEQCHSLPSRVTVSPSLAPAAEVGEGAVEGSSGQRGSRPGAMQPFHRWNRKLWAAAGELWKLDPSPHGLLLLLLAGKTVILLIAFTTAKPSGQRSHLEKRTESSAHRLRIPKLPAPVTTLLPKEEESVAVKKHIRDQV